MYEIKIGIDQGESLQGLRQGKTHASLVNAMASTPLLLNSSQIVLFPFLSLRLERKEKL
ncbi:DUF4129 domain-containing protein [Sesbania bispinosa]|nr:DUF4129 domain-containing protein [Sesbania bispinosa]